jgi:hypothetical protein
MKKLDKLLYKTMMPTLSQDLKLDEISGGFDSCKTRIREQQDKYPSPYLSGAC